MKSTEGFIERYQLPPSGSCKYASAETQSASGQSGVGVGSEGFAGAAVMAFQGVLFNLQSAVRFGRAIQHVSQLLQEPRQETFHRRSRVRRTQHFPYRWL